MEITYDAAVLKNRFKLVVVGDGACGKTCLLTVFKVSMVENYLIFVNRFGRKTLKVRFGFG